MPHVASTDGCEVSSRRRRRRRPYVREISSAKRDHLPPVTGVALDATRARPWLCARRIAKPTRAPADQMTVRSWSEVNGPGSARGGGAECGVDLLGEDEDEDGYSPPCKGEVVSSAGALSVTDHPGCAFPTLFEAARDRACASRVDGAATPPVPGGE